MWSKRSRNKKGFTLIEMLISILIFASVMAVIYLMFYRSREEMRRRELQAETATNARVAIDSLSMDLRQIGFNCDDNTEGYLGDIRLTTADIIRQPSFVYGDPWQVVFNADLDSHKADTDQLGPINPGLAGYSYPPGSGMKELYYICRGSGCGTGKTITVGGDYGSTDQGVGLSGNLGAETIRYTLDLPHTVTGGDGNVTLADREENYWNDSTIDEPDNQTPNPFDYILFKQIVGQNNLGVNTETYEPVAYGIRAWGGPADDYVNGMQFSAGFDNAKPKPMPMFQYFGHFYRNHPTADPGDPSDVNPDEEPLDLWGDFGHDGLPNNHEHIHEGDGQLCPIEVNQLYRSLYGLTSHPFHEVGMDPLGVRHYDETPLVGSWDPTQDDFNGNGLYDMTLDDVISRVVVTITSEARERDPKYNNPRVLNFNPHTGIDQITDYRYHDTLLTTTIYPRNISNTESRDDVSAPPQLTRTSAPKLTPTPTPIPSNTATTVLSPTSTPTSTPSPTSTFTPVTCISGTTFIVDTADLNGDGYPDIIRQDTFPLTPDIANISSFWLTNNSFSSCLAGTTDHFKIRVRSFDTLTVIPTVSPQDTPVPDSYFTGNVDWEMDIFYDDDPFSPYYDQVRAVMRDWNLATGSLNLPATTFDVPVNLMDMGTYNPGPSSYGRNHTLAGALIYHDNNPYDGSSDYLWIEINAYQEPWNRYGVTYNCQGCYELFDSATNACIGVIPYVRIIDPDPDDPSDACNGCNHGFKAQYSTVPSLLNLTADFYRDNTQTSSDRPISGLDYSFTDFINSYTEMLGFEHEYIVSTDLSPQGYNCTVHDVVLISVMPSPTPSPSPTDTPTPTPTPTTTASPTPLCPFAATDIGHLSATIIAANEIEFTFQNNSSAPIAFNYWKLNTSLQLPAPSRKIDRIQFQSGLNPYGNVWFNSFGFPQTSEINWDSTGIADVGQVFRVKIRFINAGTIIPQGVIYILGPECSKFWLGPNSLTLTY